MKLSVLIKLLEDKKATLGDIELSVRGGDGKASWFADIKEVKIVHSSIWPGHPQGKHWFVQIVDKY